MGPCGPKFMKFEFFEFTAACKSLLDSVGVVSRIGQKPFDDEFFCSRGHDRCSERTESLSSSDNHHIPWSHGGVYICRHF